MKKFIIAIPKVLFAIICYISTLLLAVLSAYFTIIFYSNSQTGWNVWAMGGLAGMLEFIKIMLAVAFPFMQYRDIKREKKVSFYLRICFFLSIMASMYFFMSGGEIEMSPASNIVSLLYTYIPLLNIIPLKFAQFISTMSLSILVEAFIIFLPMLAPILFLEKDLSRKKKYNATTNFEKLKEIMTVIPERIIDNLHQKIVGTNEEEVIIKEVKDKPVLKVLNHKTTLRLENKKNDSAFVRVNDSKELNYNKDTEAKRTDDFVRVSDLEIVKNAILNNQNENNIAPSLSELEKLTELPKRTIQAAKRELDREGIIKTEGNKTFIISEKLN
jgi:hypothetical protein